MPQANPYPLRVERLILEKFKTIAKANGRSVNKEIEQIMIAAVAAYEKEHGEIKVNLD